MWTNAKKCLGSVGLVGVSTHLVALCAHAQRDLNTMKQLEVVLVRHNAVTWDSLDLSFILQFPLYLETLCFELQLNASSRP